MTFAAGDAHPYCIYNARLRLTFPILDADGDLVSGATTPDSEGSQDSGTFADLTNEITELATNSGVYFLDLINTETDCKVLAIIVKSATAGAKTTTMVIHPMRLPVLRTGTAQAGAASTITLDSGASAVDDFYVGCLVNITNNSPANVQGMCRKIIDYVGSTKVATVESAWGTNPSSASTFEILAPPEAQGQGSIWAGTVTPDPNTVGYPIVTIKDGTGTGEIDTTSGGVLVSAIAANAITAAAIATDAIGAAELAADALAEIKTQVTDALNVDTYAEIGQENPAATQTIRKMVHYLYKAFRNRKTQTATQWSLMADDQTTVDQKATVSDDGTTAIKQEIVTGP